MQLQQAGGRPSTMGTTAADKRRDNSSHHRGQGEMSMLANPISDAQQLQQPLPQKTRLTLERVLGVTSLSNAMLAVNPVTGEIAYAAGCIVVIYNLRRNKQVRYYRVEKSVSCLCFSPTGQYLAIGEKGYLPAITIWDGADGTLCAELQMHKYGVACMAFSRDGKYLLSAGLVHDQHMYAWDLTRASPGEPMNSKAVGVATVTEKILAMDYCHEGNFFVTVGEKHFHFWFLDADNKFLTTGYEVDSLPEIQGRAAVMAAKEEATFTSVGCGYGACKLKTFAVTTDGTLCSFGVSCVMERLVSLEASCGNAISVTEAYIAVGGASSIIRLFDPSTLEYKATMPFPPPFGKANEPPVEPPPQTQSLQPEPAHRYPAAIGVRLTGSHVVALYSDRSLFIFDISNPQAAHPDRSFLFHSGCIRDLKIAGKLRGVNAKGKLVYHQGSDSLAARKTKSEAVIPQGTFVTCGDDNTVRFWHLDLHRPPKSSRFSNEIVGEDHPENEPWKNPFSQELLEILYFDQDSDFDDEDAIVLGGTCSATHVPDIHSPSADTIAGAANAQRTIALHPTGTMVVAGDKEGGVVLRSLPFEETAPSELGMIGAEVNALAFGEIAAPLGSKLLIAAAGRDRLVHVYDSSKGFASAATLDNHSGAVTGVLFTHDGKRLISCGADKTIVLSEVAVDGKISRYNSIPFPGGKIFDVALTSDDQQLVASSNNRLDVLSVVTGKQLRSLHVGEQHHIDVCPADFCVAMSGSLSDKTIHIVDLQSGETLADGTGHGEVVTGIKFTPDCRRLVSASSDGCVFVWRLAEELQAAIKARLPRIVDAAPAPPPAPPVPVVQASERSIPAPALLPPPAPPVQAKRVPSVAPTVSTNAEPKTVAGDTALKKDETKGWKGKGIKPAPGPFAKTPMDDWMRTRESAKKTVHVEDDEPQEDQVTGVMNIDRSKTPDWARTFQVSAVPVPARKSPSKIAAPSSKWAQRQPIQVVPAHHEEISLDTTSTDDTLLQLSIAKMDVSQSGALAGSSLALEREQLEKRKKQMETAKAVADMNSRLTKMGLLRSQKAAPLSEARPSEASPPKPTATVPEPPRPTLSPVAAVENARTTDRIAGIPAEMFESIEIPSMKALSTTGQAKSALTKSVDMNVDQSMSVFTDGFSTAQHPKPSAVAQSGELRVDQSMSVFTAGFSTEPSQPPQLPIDQSLSNFSDGYKAEVNGAPSTSARGDVDASLSAFTQGFAARTSSPVGRSADLTAVATSISVFTQGYTTEAVTSKPIVAQSMDMSKVMASLSHFTAGYESEPVEANVSLVNQSMSSFTSGFTTSPPHAARSSVSALPVNESLSTFTRGYNADKPVSQPEVSESLSVFTAGYHESSTGLEAASVSPSPPQATVEKHAQVLSTISDLDVQLLATTQVLRSLALDAESDTEVVALQDLIAQLRTAVEQFVSKR